MDSVADLDSAIAAEQAVEAPGVTHLKYTVVT